jgi:hypothetical protein
LKKRTKKLLLDGTRLGVGPRQLVKSFLLLFLKKEDLPFSLGKTFSP